MFCEDRTNLRNTQTYFHVLNAKYNVIFFFKFIFEQVELEVERHVLRTKVVLSDKTEGLVFTRSKTRNESNMFNYICHLCGVNNLPGERCLQTHIAGRKHQMKLQSPIDAKTFRSPITRNKPQSKFSFYTHGSDQFPN